MFDEAGARVRQTIKCTLVDIIPCQENKEKYDAVHSMLLFQFRVVFLPQNKYFAVLIDCSQLLVTTAIIYDCRNRQRKKYRTQRKERKKIELKKERKSEGTHEINKESK